MRKTFTPALKRSVVLFSILICILQGHGQAPTIVFQQAITGLSNPVDIVNAGDGSHRIFVVQQAGTIKIYNQALGFIGDFITIPGVTFTGTGDERGLLSLVFHPNYATNRFFYIWYASTTGGITSVHLDRYQTSENNANLADPNSKQAILSIDKPGGFTNHNGAKLNFGPDGYLYVATGDGGNADDLPFNNAQNGNSLLGKMLRIDVNTPNPPFAYSIPPTNPYVNDPDVLDEIWALGLRNPWRWSFDKLTNDMWIGDVGQGQREEVNFRPAGNTGGINYGWRCFEGTRVNTDAGVPPCNPATPPNYVPPIFEYAHDANGGVTVIGGYVYRGSEYPSLYGYYITGDYLRNHVWLLHSDGTSDRQNSAPTSLFTFGEAEDGTLYAAAGSTVYKIVAIAQAPTPVKLLSFTLRQLGDYNDISWKTAMESNVREFSIQSSDDAVNFASVGKVSPSNQQNGASYSFRHFTSARKKIYYRLQTIDNDGTFDYSKIISTSSRNDMDPIKLYPPAGSSMLVELNAPFNGIRVINMYGQTVLKQATGNASGIIYLNTAGWKKGVYILIGDNGEEHVTRKFLIQ